MIKHKKEKNLKLRPDEEFTELPWEHDAKLLFALFHPQVLVQIAHGTINAQKLAQDELASRGLNHEGKWLGLTDY